MLDDANSESNLNLGEDSQITTGGDVVAGNQIRAGGHFIHAEAGATVVVGATTPPTPPADTPPAPGESPFKGLQYFDVADAGLFFGREALVEKLAARFGLLATDFVADVTDAASRAGSSVTSVTPSAASFLAIVGASGSGKSSLVRAGLVPSLKRESPVWQVHLITPTAHPLKELAASLTRDSESLTATTTLMDDLARDGRSLDLAASRLLKKVGGGERLLLVIDQFEELSTACKDEAEKQAFVDNVLMAVAPETAGPTLVILTLRADFYAHCAQYTNLREAIAAQQEYIGPMGMEELRRAIEEPAVRGGWTFESGLVELLLRDVGAGENRQPEPGALPLLSHALLETWKRRSGRTLTLKGYDESGGVRGAIAKTAETVYGQLSPEGQSIARNIFLRLTELGEGTQDTRRRAALNELITNNQLQPAVESVLKVLADARLITTGERAAEVAHEALIREWPALRGWLDENREGLRLHRHLTEAAGAWATKLNRDPGELYRGARLAQAIEWAGSNDDQLNPLEREFLTASKDLAKREVAEREAQQQREIDSAKRFAEAAQKLAEAERQAAARLRIRNRVVTALGAIALLLATAALWFATQSNRQAQISFAGKLAAQGQALYEDDPLLGLRLALESFAFAPPDDEATRQSTAEVLRKLIAPGRVLKLGDDVETLYPNLDNTLFVIDYAIKPDELRYTADNGPVQTLSGDVADFGVSFGPGPQASYLAVSYSDGTPGELRHIADGSIVPLSGDVAEVTISPDLHAASFVVRYADGKPGELRRTADGSLVQTLSDDVLSVVFSPDSRTSYFVVSYFGDTPSELRRTADGSLVQTLSDHVLSVVFSPDPQASYFIMDYTNMPGELRRTADGSLVQTLSLSLVQTLAGYVASVSFSPDPQAAYFVVSYYEKPGELRRAADGSLVQTLSGIVNISSLFFSPDPQTAYFVANYDDGTSELWTTEDKPRGLSQLGLGLYDPSYRSFRAFFEMKSRRLILHYSDRRAYILDLALLSKLGGDPESFSPEELTRIACEQLFQPGEFDESQLGPYLEGREARGCG